MAKVIAIIGTYRKGKNIDTAVSKILEGAKSCGAEVERIYLTDAAIEFCTNCFACTTSDLGKPRAKCVIDDDMEEILDKIDAADGIVLASPVNVGTVTAIMKRFIERLSVYVYWQLDGKVRPPKKRIKKLTKKAVLVTSSTMPAVMGRIFISNVMMIMKAAAELTGAKVIARLWFGMIPASMKSELKEKDLKKCYKVGQKLCS